MAPSYELFVRHKSKTLQREERRYFNLIRKVAKTLVHCSVNKVMTHTSNATDKDI